MHAKFQVSSFIRYEVARGYQKLKVVPLFLSVRGSGPSYNTMSYGPPRVFTPNSILIRSAVFALWSPVEPRVKQTAWRTDPRTAVTIGWISCIACIRWSLKWTFWVKNFVWQTDKQTDVSENVQTHKYTYHIKLYAFLLLIYDSVTLTWRPTECLVSLKMRTSRMTLRNASDALDLALEQLMVDRTLKSVT